MVEDAADDELVAGRRAASGSTASCAISATSAPAGSTPSRVPGAAARGEGRGARRRRPRRLVGLGARLHRRRRDVADRRRPGRDQQPQPPDPLHRGRHRPAQGRGARQRGCARSTRGCGSPPTARRLESEDEIAEFIAGADVVIDAADWPAHDIERWCNSACFEAGIPYITMSHFPPVARVGPLYVPGKTGCFVCQEIGYRREYPLFDVADRAAAGETEPGGDAGPRLRADRRPGGDGGDAPADRAEPSPRRQGVAHIYDLRTMEVKREPVMPEPECPVCGGMPHEEAAARSGGRFRACGSPPHSRSSSPWRAAGRLRQLRRDDGTGSDTGGGEQCRPDPGDMGTQPRTASAPPGPRAGAARSAPTAARASSPTAAGQSPARGPASRSPSSSGPEPRRNRSPAPSLQSPNPPA